MCKSDATGTIKSCVLPLQQLNVDLCRTSGECLRKNPKKPVCKEEKNKKTCVGLDQCLSNCTSTQVCSSKHECEDPPKCTIDGQCLPWETCQQISEEVSQRFCLTTNPSPGLDQCSTSRDCEVKSTEKVMCKEKNRRKVCVKPDLCKSKCAKDELCDEEDKCRAPEECRNDESCKSNEFCKKSGFNGKSFCSVKPGSPRPSSDECGAGYDCTKQNGKSVCKELGGKRVCVQPEQCLAKCKKTEFCSGEGKCKPARECKSGADCKGNEICAKSTQIDKPKICILKPGAPPPKVDECGSNKDCSSKNPLTICKSNLQIVKGFLKNNVKLCVPMEQCATNCSSNELCDSNNICQSSEACETADDCETGEVCKRFTPDGEKVCFFSSFHFFQFFLRFVFSTRDPLQRRRTNVVRTKIARVAEKERFAKSPKGQGNA